MAFTQSPSSGDSEMSLIDGRQRGKRKSKRLAIPVIKDDRRGTFWAVASELENRAFAVVRVFDTHAHMES